MIIVIISLFISWLLAKKVLARRGNHTAQFWISVALLGIGCMIMGYAMITERATDGMGGIYYAVIAGLTFWILVLPAAVSLAAFYFKDGFRIK